MNAIRATFEKGVVPGGSVVLLRAKVELDNLELEGDQALGLNILEKALEEPLRRIVTHAGLEPSMVLEKVLSNHGSYGFNAQMEGYGDLLKAGVIDPTEVVRMALQNAASVASPMLTTDAMVEEKPKKKEPTPGPVGPGGGMSDYGDY